MNQNYTCIFCQIGKKCILGVLPNFSNPFMCATG